MIIVNILYFGIMASLFVGFVITIKPMLKEVIKELLIDDTEEVM